jgi:hypothetical protein
MRSRLAEDLLGPPTDKAMLDAVELRSTEISLACNLQGGIIFSGLVDRIECDGRRISRRAMIGGGCAFALAARTRAQAAVDITVNGHVNVDVGSKTISSLTWSGVGLAVIGGIASGLGARSLGAILGDKSADLDLLIRAFTKQVDLVVRQVIADNERDKLAATVKGLGVLFWDYYNSPNPRLLDDLHTRTVLGVTEAERLGLPAVASYTICGSLMLSVYEQLHLQSPHDDGLRKNLMNGAVRLVNGVPRFTEALRKSNASRFSTVAPRSWSGPMGLVSVPIYKFDNDEVLPALLPGGVTAYQYSYAKDQLEKKRSAHVISAFSGTEDTLLGGLYQVREEWKRLANSS